jgi:transposase-like protein
MNQIMKIDVELQNKIFTIRGVQVMLDSHLATLYKVETKVFNQAVKRNESRFPDRYRFQLTEKEFNGLRSQIVTSNKRGGRRYLPYVFTEQGVSMLSAVLKSDTAVEISLKIIDGFVAMRRFISQNAGVFQRIDNIEQKLLNHDDKFNQIFKALEAKTLQPQQGIFYDGQIFEAYAFVCDLIKNAKHYITLVDNYVDETVLTLFSKNLKVKITIYTKTINDKLKLDANKYNAQYNNLEIRPFDLSHDRFLLIDDEIYHIGASLKDLGKKWFAFSKMDNASLQLAEKLK